ncbi:hypothetical protein GF342_02335 [Candidatus Woesearchaeota archaeon]|nr:hypothetical protein [Candidatus Woesearchaeota archaeon]
MTSGNLEWLQTVTCRSGYKSCFHAAQDNSKGFIYLVGGSVFRYAAWWLYSRESEYPPNLLSADFDFLVEELVASPQVPECWTRDDHSSGGKECPRFRPGTPGTVFRPDGSEVQFSKTHLSLVERGIAVDILPIAHLYGLRGVSSPSVEQYCGSVPLSIQALGVRLDRRTGNALDVCGDVGLDALASRTVSINNEESAWYSARKRRLSLEEYARQKARSLGFDVVS